MFGVKFNMYKINSVKTSKDVFNFLINETHDETLALEGFKASAMLSHGNRKIIYGNNVTATIVSYDESNTYLDTAGNIIAIHPDMFKNREVTTVSKAVKLTSEAMDKKSPLDLLLYNNGIWRLTIQLNNNGTDIVYKASFIYKNGTYGSSELELLDYNNGEKTAVACTLKIPKDIEDRAVAFHRGLIKYRVNNGNKNKKSNKSSKTVNKSSKTVNKSKTPKQKKISYKDYIYNLDILALQNPETGKIAVFKSRDEFIRALQLCKDYTAFCKSQLYKKAKHSIETNHYSRDLIISYGNFMSCTNKDIGSEIGMEIWIKLLQRVKWETLRSYKKATFEGNYDDNELVYCTLSTKETPISSLLVHILLSERERKEYEALRNNSNSNETEKYIELASERLAKKLIKHYERYSGYKSRYIK